MPATFSYIEWSTLAAKSNIQTTASATDVCSVDFSVAAHNTWLGRGYNLTGRVYVFTTECSTTDGRNLASIAQSNSSTFTLSESSRVSHFCGNVNIANLNVGPGDYIGVAIEFNTVTATTAVAFNWACSIII